MPLLPFIRNEFSLSYTRASFVTSAFALANGTGQLPAGFLADRVGPRILILVGTLGVAAGGVLVGLSQTYIMLLVFLAGAFAGPAAADGIIIPDPPFCDFGPCPEPFPITQLAIEYHRVDVTI